MAKAARRIPRIHDIVFSDTLAGICRATLGAGAAVSGAEAMRQLLERIERVDLDVFEIGEHHRIEFLDSAPAVILVAAAARTRRIRLTSAVAVLSAADTGPRLPAVRHARPDRVGTRGDDRRPCRTGDAHSWPVGYRTRQISRADRSDPWAM